MNSLRGWNFRWEQDFIPVPFLFPPDKLLISTYNIHHHRDEDISQSNPLKAD